MGFSYILEKNMKHHFFALASRTKYIHRWALMRNTTEETLSQHSYEVATLSHALAVIGNKRFSKQYDASRAALLGLYHDVPEIITGDMPTPIKYFNGEMREAYSVVERHAGKTLLSMLPEDLRGEYESLLLDQDADTELHKIVKAADKLSAYIKCVEERKAGNAEFSDAEQATLEAIHKLQMPEAETFLEEFMPSYLLPLDQLK